MPYLFHEPVRPMVPSRANALAPGLALAIAILGTAVVTIAVAAALA